MDLHVSISNTEHTLALDSKDIDDDDDDDNGNDRVVSRRHGIQYSNKNDWYGSKTCVIAYILEESSDVHKCAYLS